MVAWRHWGSAAAALASVANANVVFASLGNFGTGSSTQSAVASQLKTHATREGLSFVISPGSNFINGLVDENDTLWDNGFTKPYKGSELNMPFFTVMGEEDWKGNYSALAAKMNTSWGLGPDDNEGQHAGPKWTLPNWWYYYSTHFSDSSEANGIFGSSDGSVGFVFIDTKILQDSFRLPNITELHWNQLRQTLGVFGRIFDWVIVVGDKSMLSSGSSKGDSYLNRTLRPLLKEMRVDAYISGNDYDMEMIEDGDMLHINCGTGAGGDSLPRKKVANSVAYSTTPGFCIHKLTRNHFETSLVDGMSGKTLTTYSKARVPRPRSWFDRFNVYKSLPKVSFVDIPPLQGTTPLRGDWFVRVVGTMGLLASLFALGLCLMTMMHRAAKEQRRR